jgi:hypothetical protein
MQSIKNKFFKFTKYLISNQLVQRIILALKILLDEPIIFLCVTIFLFHPRFSTGFLVLLSWISMGVCSAQAGWQHNNLMYQSLIDTYLKHYPGCGYTSITLRDVFGEDFLKRVERYYPRYLTINDEMGYLCIVKRQVRGAKFPAAFTTFPLYHDPSYIMVRDHPLNMTAFQRYCLFHELGHLSFDQYQFHLRAPNHKIQMIIVAVVISILSHGAALAIFGSVAAYFIWTTHAVETAKQDISQEIVADAFATYHLANDPEFEHIKKQVNEYIQRAEKDKDRCQARLSLFELSLDDLAQKSIHTNTNEIDNPTRRFSVFSQDIWMPTGYYYSVHAGILIFCSAFTSNPTWTNVATLSIPMLLVPLLILSYTMNKKDSLREEVEATVGVDINRSPAKLPFQVLSHSNNSVEADV